MDHNKLGFLFSDVNQHAPKRQPNGPSEPASKRPKPDSTERPHKRPADGHHKSTTPGTKSSHQHKVPLSDSKKKVPPKVKRPVIEDSDEDDDDIDGNLLSRKKNVTTVPVQSANKPTKSVKTEKRKESPVHKPKPEQDKKFQVKVEKKSPETPKPPSTKQQTKSSTSVAKGRVDKQNSVPVKSEVKSEPMETSSKEKHDKKTKRLSAGSKRQHEEDSEDEFSVSSLSDDEDESSDEPVALGLNSESDDSYSDRDDDFKAKKSKPRLKAEAKKETPKSASTTTKKVSAKKEPKKIEKSSPAVTKTTPAKKKDKPATPLKKESVSPQKKKKKEEEREVWKWWEEERLPEGIKWKTLEHKGPYFPPLYEPLPKHVKFLYDGKPVALAPETEEVAGFFGKMLEHEYTKKDIFIQNFWSDWRKVMTAEEAKLIRDFRKCDFNQINQYYKDKSEARKQMSKEEKLKIKEENEQIIEEYGWALMDGHKERIGNFKIEPPGLFRGRGDHPKQGMIKKRVQPEDVTINIGKDAKIPAPPDGHKWKAVSHDNSVTWLASWTENIQGQIKYVMLNPTSRIKGEKDWMKYETARKLKTCVDAIRKQYYEDLKSKEMRIRQRATALYFIDKLALRAGNEKDPDESADTVGCCSLRVEHIKLHEALDGETNVVEFDFLGKDSIRYQNHVSVDKQVFKNLRLFTKGKDPGHDLFDRLSTSDLNKHLQELMEGLTAKVFRTYNASNTLQEQLALLTSANDLPPAKLLSYNRANRAVAVLCNHQRAPPKTFDQQMENLQKKIDAKKDSVKEAEKDMKDAKKSGDKKKVDVAKRKVERLKEQLHKLELQATDKEENKEIALGTSKLNYLDPRISVSWCKKWDVPVEKVYNKTQRQKFAWAIDMADDSFVF